MASAILAGGTQAAALESPEKGIYGMKAKKTILIIAVSVIGVLLNIFIFYNLFTPVIGNGGIDFSIGGDNVAVLNIEGIIMAGTPQSYDQSWVINTLDKIINDNGNRALVLKINTPGGAIYECDEIYFKLLEYKDTGRPIYAALGKNATSGGYYIACAADKIFADRNTITGSIGVASGTFIDITGFLEKNGVRIKNVTSGKNKAMGSLFESFTQEQLDIMQSIADEAYEQFIDIVATGRGLEADDVRKIADGRLLTAKQALSLKLIDEIASFNQVRAKIDSLEGMQGLRWKEFKYVPKTSLWDILLNIKSSAPQTGLLEELNSARIRLPGYLAEIES